MSKDLHIIPKQPVPAGQKWNKATGCLTLNKASVFTVTIENLENYIDKLYPKPKPFTAVKEEVYNNMTRDSKRSYEQKSNDYNEAVDAYEKNIAKQRAKIEWCWQVAGKRVDSDKIFHNDSFSLGISDLNTNQISFPKLLEGGGMAWLEIFTDKNPPLGIPPHGMFVHAVGVPKVIAAEWRDYTGEIITEEIAFGSTVYLHIYTEALYGENIEIQLRDTKLANADLTPTPTDKDGDPTQKLDAKPITRFKRPVSIHQYDKTTMPPSGTITDAIISEKGEKQVSNSNVQKCVFPVFVELAWQFQGAGNFDSGSKLSINPIVYHAKIEDGETDIDAVLKVSKNGILMQGALSGNNPLMQGEAEKGEIPEDQKKIDFTFGVFIDGTLNSMYNTEARQAFETRTGKRATSQKIVEKNQEEKYRFVDESSYENDLSNPAILFKNYVTDETNEKHPIFKIYTEGIGTLTSPNEKGELNIEDYKNDNTVGYGLGTRSVWENTGIKAKVRKAVTAMANKILQIMNENEGYKIGTITIDVFGFSRGAAAARNFIHEVTYPAYYATMGLESAYCDQHGYTVSESYFERKKPLPTNGHLGYLLTEGNQKKFDKLEVRFAGIYDTVPHHGLVQSNDIEDLGLNSVNKANYVVHLAAADEHRANFNLVNISSVTKTPPESGKKGGIELYLPGVHCDVGGSYIEGMPENKKRIDASFDYHELAKLKNELVKQGWFKKEELYIEDGNYREITDTNFKSVITKMALNSKRSYISNQYSFIPLYMMADFCKLKNVSIKERLLTDYKFKENKLKGNIQFLNKVQTRLNQYAFNNGEFYGFTEAPKFKQPDIVYDPQQSHQALQEYHERQLAGQAELDQEAATKNADLMQLRNHYLHWNAVYAQPVKLKDSIDIAIQAHAPDKTNGKRKRTIR